jgi:FRG domain
MAADREINSFNDLHAAVQTFGEESVVKDASKPPVPKIGRYGEFDEKELLYFERRLLREFKIRAVPFVKFDPETDWEWLALAQHSGLPTRLLDWARNSLVAAYFAVRDDYEGDSLLYAYQSNISVDTVERPSPFEIDRVWKFIPRHINPRIVAQTGLFTVHPKPTEAFEDANLHRFRIKRDARRGLKRVLYQYGVHSASLFPDLDGLTAHLEWLLSDKY